MEFKNLMESLNSIESGDPIASRNADERYGPMSTDSEDSGWGDELIEDLRLLIIDGQDLSTHAILTNIEDLISQYTVTEEVTEDTEERYDADIVIQALQDIDFENDDEYNYNQMLSARINQSFPNGITATDIQELINEPNFQHYSSGADLLSHTFRSAGLDDLAINY